MKSSADELAKYPKILPKIVNLKLSHGNLTLETYAIKDDGSERTLLLPLATAHLRLDWAAKRLSMQTLQ